MSTLISIYQILVLQVHTYSNKSINFLYFWIWSFSNLIINFEYIYILFLHNYNFFSSSTNGFAFINFYEFFYIFLTKYRNSYKTKSRIYIFISYFIVNFNIIWITKFCLRWTNWNNKCYYICFDLKLFRQIIIEWFLIFVLITCIDQNNFIDLSYTYKPTHIFSTVIIHRLIETYIIDLKSSVDMYRKNCSKYISRLFKLMLIFPIILNLKFYYRTYWNLYYSIIQIKFFVQFIIKIFWITEIENRNHFYNKRK